MEGAKVGARSVTENPACRRYEIDNSKAREGDLISVATRLAYFLCVAASLVVCLSCTSISNTSTTAPGNSTDNSAQRNAGMSQAGPNEVSTDVEALSKLVKLPIRPISVVWRRQVRGAANSQVPGPTDWQLEALLTFEDDGAEHVSDEAKKSEKPRDIGSIESIDWLPSEVRDHFEPGANSYNYKVKGEAYSADAFAKPPLSQGYLIRLGESPQFFLKLYTQ